MPLASTKGVNGRVIVGATFCTGKEPIPVKRGLLSNASVASEPLKMVVLELSKRYVTWSWINVSAPLTRSYVTAPPPRITVFRSPNTFSRNPPLGVGDHAKLNRGA